MQLFAGVFGVILQLFAGIFAANIQLFAGVTKVERRFKFIGYFNKLASEDLQFIGE